MYAGEGEPFLHKDFCEMVKTTKAAGIDVAITTNGVLMTPVKVDQVIPDCSWIKISFNAGTAPTYASIHQTGEDDFNKVIKNLRHAVKLKRGNGYKCTLGLQMILLPENFKEAEGLAEIGKDVGVDYLVIKPYSQHPLSKTRKYGEIKYSELMKLEKKLEKYSTGNYSVIFRTSSMKKWDKGSKSYCKCRALPFWSYVDSDGNVWGCSMFLGDERFHYGNIKTTTFKEIWEGEKRRSSLDFVANELNTTECRINCRMDTVNEYLEELKNPLPHVNFI